MDAIDQMMRHYTTRIGTCRWPLGVFCNVLDIAALNAFVLWKAISNDNSVCRDIPTSTILRTP